MKRELLTGFATACLSLPWAIATGAGNDVGCSASARLLDHACVFDVRDEYLVATARCLDSSEPEPACADEAGEEMEEAEEECADVFEAPDETITVTVTDETKLVDGVRCVTVTDIVTGDGQLIEDTDDWYAQDIDGNVWYCGEIARNFETFEGDDPEAPELVDLDGSWKAGREGAEPGILLPAPGLAVVGQLLRQAVAFGEAEDYIVVLSTTASETAPAAACAGTCLQTNDLTTLEPDADEHKFFAPGVGLIVEVDIETGDRVELVEFTTAQ